MDKHEIDKIFREGFNNPPSNQFEEEHWHALEHRLGKKNNSRKLFIWSLLGSAVAACLLIFFFVNNNNTINNNSAEISIANNGADFDAKPEEPQHIILDSNTSQQAELNANNIFKIAPVRRIRLQSAIDEQIINSTISNISDIIYKEDSVENEVIIVDYPKAIVPKETDTSSTVENRLAENIIETVKSKDSQIEPIEKETKTNKRATLSVLAALDLTDVRGAGQQKLSQNVGLLYTQPIHKNISMSTGILYSSKKYESPYSYYKPVNPYKGSHIPTDVSAVCDVISVPVLVNYQLHNGKSYSVNVSSGLSSYFMLKEKYKFFYNGEGYSPYTSEYTIKGKNQHYFGVADFSISINRTINNKLSIGIRPFVQIPLTGIGYGRTNLQSKGVALSFGIIP